MGGGVVVYIASLGVLFFVYIATNAENVVIILNIILLCTKFILKLRSHG